VTRSSQPDQPRRGDGFDLDALIGDLQGEAARRRAAPGFPLDDEARLGLALDRQAPQPLAPELERLAELATRAGTRPEIPPPTRRGWRFGPAASERPGATATGEEQSLSGVVARALRTVSDRLVDLEVRLRRLELRGAASAPDVVGPAAAGAAGGPTAGFAAWKGRLPEHLPLPPARILCSGVDAEEGVGILRSSGVDGYGLVPDGDRYRTHPDVRQGALRPHLAAVSDGGLGAVVLVEPWIGEGVAGIRDLVPELARVTPIVVVVSEAPWWWRARVGSVDADLAAARPLAAETWLYLLDRAGFVSSAEYDEPGSSYRVVGRRPR
jgi:hypothetical protein